VGALSSPHDRLTSDHLFFEVSDQRLNSQADINRDGEMGRRFYIYEDVGHLCWLVWRLRKLALADQVDE
jgi:hypothetical protein